MAARVRASFQPEWSGSVEGWVVNYINAHLWRVRPQFEFDDLFQEAYVCFAVCCERYPAVIDPPHFMALFKRTFTNRVVDMSNRRTKDKAFSYDENSELGPPPNSGDLLERQQRLCPEMMAAEADMLVADAPSPIQELVATIQSAPEELLGFLRGETTGLRETMEDRLARLGGLATWASFAVDPQGCKADFRATVEGWACA